VDKEKDTVDVVDKEKDTVDTVDKEKDTVDVVDKEKDTVDTVKKDTVKKDTVDENKKDKADKEKEKREIPEQQELKDITSAKFKDMLNECKNSLRVYIEHVRNAYLKDPKYLGKEPPVQLGYFLRSKDGSSLLIESKLWTEIRQMIYQMPFIRNKQIREKQEQNFKNMNHIILESYLDLSKHNIFIHIFPQFYDNYYGRYNDIVDAVVGRIANELNGIKSKPGTSKDEKIISTLTTHFSAVVSGKYQPQKTNTNFSKKPKVRIDGKVDKKLIRSMIVTTRNTERFYDAIYQSDQ
jgi:hypothetical protein